MITIGEAVAPTAAISRFRLKLRKDFGHSSQPWLTPIPGSLFDKEGLLVSIIAFFKIVPNHTRILGKIQL
ncbi:MAG: hypothetical protein CVU41_05880 [Chloroflexi bacterium HGW-Chloroflexi-3]|nr:MAG: hypothetical protein CVU41_05880 [Chloroflexi bacterium HGW-Chloroflexi-3]